MRVYCYLVVQSESQLPRVTGPGITNWAKGDRRGPPPSRLVHTAHGLQLEAPSDRAWRLQRFVGWILARADAVVSRTPSSADRSLKCAVYVDATYYRTRFAPGTLAALANLRCELDIDLYLHGPGMLNDVPYQPASWRLRVLGEDGVARRILARSVGDNAWKEFEAAIAALPTFDLSTASAMSSLASVELTWWGGYGRPPLVVPADVVEFLATRRVGFTLRSHGKPREGDSEHEDLPL